MFYFRLQFLPPPPHQKKQKQKKQQITTANDKYLPQFTRNA